MAGARQPWRGEGSAGDVCVSFLKSRQGAGGRSGRAKLLSAQEAEVTLALALLPSPYGAFVHTLALYEPSKEAVSSPERLGFIAGGAHSNVPGCVCLTMSIMVLFDYNLAEVWPISFYIYVVLCVSSLFSFWKLSRAGFSRWEERGLGHCPSYIPPRCLSASSPSPRREAPTVSG